MDELLFAKYNVIDGGDVRETFPMHGLLCYPIQTQYLIHLPWSIEMRLSFVFYTVYSYLIDFMSFKPTQLYHTVTRKNSEICSILCLYFYICNWGKFLF